MHAFFFERRTATPMHGCDTVPNQCRRTIGRQSGGWFGAAERALVRPTWFHARITRGRSGSRFCHDGRSRPRAALAPLARSSRAPDLLALMELAEGIVRAFMSVMNTTEASARSNLRRRALVGAMFIAAALPSCGARDRAQGVDNDFVGSPGRPQIDSDAAVSDAAVSDAVVSDAVVSDAQRDRPRPPTSLTAQAGTRGRTIGPGVTADNGDVAVDPNANALFVSERGGSDTTRNRIVRVFLDGQTTPFAGAGQQGGSDGPAPDATFFNPLGLALDHAGNLYVADAGNKRIRRVAASGAVSTFAQIPGSASLWKVAFTKNGDLVSSDPARSVLYRTDLLGKTDVFAGRFYGHRDGPRNDGAFEQPRGIAADASDTLWVGDNRYVRKVDPKGSITTVAEFAAPSLVSGVATTAEGLVYVSDQLKNQIVRLGPNGRASVVADGKVAPAVPGDVPALIQPGGISIDRMGNLFVASGAIPLVMLTLGGGVNELVVRWLPREPAKEPSDVVYKVTATAAGQPSVSCETVDFFCTLVGLAPSSYKISVRTTSTSRGESESSAEIQATPLSAQVP